MRRTHCNLLVFILVFTTIVGLMPSSAFAYTSNGVVEIRNMDSGSTENYKNEILWWPVNNAVRYDYTFYAHGQGPSLSGSTTGTSVEIPLALSFGGYSFGISAYDGKGKLIATINSTSPYVSVHAVDFTLKPYSLTVYGIHYDKQVVSYGQKISWNSDIVSTSYKVHIYSYESDDTTTYSIGKTTNFSIPDDIGTGDFRIWVDGYNGSELTATTNGVLNGTVGPIFNIADIPVPPTPEPPTPEPPAPDSPTPEPVYCISGRVIDDSDGTPVSGAIVQAGSTSAATDENGEYTLTGLENGDCTITVSKSGYATISGINQYIDNQSVEMPDIRLVGTPPPVGQINIVTPVSDQQYTTGNVHFAWDGAEGASQYELFFDNGDSPDQTVSGDTTEYDFLYSAGSYVFRVEAYNGKGQMIGTGSVSFSISLNHAVKVTVINKDTNEHLSDVSLTLENQSGTTSGEGYYEFENIQNGIYTITATKSGFKTYTENITVTDQDVECSVDMESEETTYTISGRVIDDSDGAPLSGATVQEGNLIATTNEDGEFILTGLESGSYTISVSMDGYQSIGGISEYIDNQSIAIADIRLAKASSIIITLQIGSTIITVNGQPSEIDPGMGTVPVIINGRTLLPIRKIIESIGGQVSWDEGNRMVTLNYNGKTIYLWIDATVAQVDSSIVSLDVPPIIINGRTMLPLRFIAENLGFNVQWDEYSQQVTISNSVPTL